MPEDEIIEDAPLVETPPPVEQEEDQPEPQEDGSLVYADGYRIAADGRHFGADGTEIPETVEETPPVVEEPVTPAPVARAAEPAPVQQGDRRVFNYENAYTPQELELLQRLDISDPGRAATLRHQRCREVDNYSADQFDRDLDQFAAVAPETVTRYQRQIERARRSLSPEQMQQPGIAKQIAVKIATEDFINDPSRLEALVTGNAGGGNRVAAASPATSTPAPVPPVTRTVGAPPTAAPAGRIQAPQDRMPAPRATRRVVPSGGATRPNGGKTDVKFIQSIYPGMDDDEAREFMAGVRQNEQNREARR